MAVGLLGELVTIVFCFWSGEFSSLAGDTPFPLLTLIPLAPMYRQLPVAL